MFTARGNLPAGFTFLLGFPHLPRILLNFPLRSAEQTATVQLLACSASWFLPPTLASRDHSSCRTLRLFINKEVAMQRIQLSQGQFAIVDDVDFPLLSDFKWCYRAERDGKQGYAVRHRMVNGKDRLCYLHREIVQPGPGQESIFLNYDKLDCRRENLRVVSKQEARQHHRVRRDSVSKSKGIRYHPDSRTWSATISRDGSCRSIGTFQSEAAAIQAYESELHRENPELYAPPPTIERTSNPQPVQPADTTQDD